MNLAEYRRYAAEFYVLDGAVPRGTLTEWLSNALYPIPPSECEISFSDEAVHIPFPNLTHVIPPLPKSYGVKGGAARSALRNILFPGLPTLSPRDIDLVRYRGRSSSLDWDLAAQFMPDDAAQGRGVEHVTSIPQYLQTRDITANEILLIDNTISVSFRGILDTRAQVLRPSRYRGGSLHAAKRLGGLTLAKMFRLKVEAAARGESWEILGIPDDQSLSSFDLAVHLDRAFVAGSDVAASLLEELTKERFLPDNGSSLLDWVRYLSDEMPEGSSFFRHLPESMRMQLAPSDESDGK